MTKNTLSDKTYKEAFDIALDEKLKEYINKDLYCYGIDKKIEGLS